MCLFSPLSAALLQRKVHSFSIHRPECIKRALPRRFDSQRQKVAARRADLRHVQLDQATSRRSPQVLDASPMLSSKLCMDVCKGPRSPDPEYSCLAACRSPISSCKQFEVELAAWQRVQAWQVHEACQRWQEKNNADGTPSAASCHRCLRESCVNWNEIHQMNAVETFL